MATIEKQIKDDQAELFHLLSEFFGRAVGQLPSDFASIDSFDDQLRKNANTLAYRAPDAFPWAYENLGKFYFEKGPKQLSAASQLGGLKLVLGGSSRFQGSQFDSVVGALLYADSVMIPDPVAPWLETAREEEKFRDVLMLKAAHTMLLLKPLIDAELPGCPLVVFPSWEKALEERDPQTSQGIFQLVADLTAHYIDPTIKSMGDLFEYVSERPDDFLQAVGRSNLFVAPGGKIGQPIGEALAQYEKEVATWRSETFLEGFKRLPPAARVANAIAERVAPQFHLVENSELLGAHPLLSVSQQAHYFKLVADLNSARLEQAGLLEPQTRALVSGLASDRLEWLTKVPLDALVEIRGNNENVEFRKSLQGSISHLHAAALEDTNKVAAEICREIDSGIAAHNRAVRETVSKNKSKYAQWGVAAAVGCIGALCPSLAPHVGAILPLVPAGKLAFDMWDHASEKKKQSKSLMGVLAVTRDSNS